MQRLNKGGIETIIAAVIVAGLIVALIWTVVIPMSNQGDDLIDKTTNNLVEHQQTIDPFAS